MKWNLLCQIEHRRLFKFTWFNVTVEKRKKHATTCTHMASSITNYFCFTQIRQGGKIHMRARPRVLVPIQSFCMLWQTSWYSISTHEPLCTKLIEPIGITTNIRNEIQYAHSNSHSHLADCYYSSIYNYLHPSRSDFDFTSICVSNQTVFGLVELRYVILSSHVSQFLFDFLSN